MNFKFTFIAVFAIAFFSCKERPKQSVAAQASKTVEGKVPHKILKEQPEDIATPQGMVWVAGKIFSQGAKANDPYAMSREKPAHEVAVDGFFMDITEVTNADYQAFVDATGYVSIAERPIDWEDMKKNLPDGTPKPADSLLQPGSLIFNKAVNAVANMDNYAQWWIWKIGANWKHPEGPKSDVKDKANFPVVHIAYEDAMAYCEWANRRLPTEAEWEAAAQGLEADAIFTWGNDAKQLNANANTWQGTFPVKNKSLDGFEFIAPTKSYPPNSIGIYDMMGNVWELTSDLFSVNHYQSLDPNTTLVNPKGATAGYNPDNPYQPEHIIKGGSFLCHASYCASFRISARMGTAFDSGSDHTGFRTVATVAMLRD